MKISKEQVEQNRNRVLDTAAKLFRERGIDGIGIADLMKASGLTHGGFYRQFKSKDEFVVEAVKRAFGMTSADIQQRLAADTSEPFEALVKHYVSGHHRDDPATGCCLTALAADAARCDNTELRSFFGNIVSNYIDLIARINPETDVTARRSASVKILAEMVGAVLLSRVVPDEKLSDEILDIVSKDLLNRY